MYSIKQSTGLTIPIFAHDVNGDGVTGLVDGGFTKRISKGGGAFGAMTVTVTEAENGFYFITLSTSHTDTLGILTVSLSHASIKRVNLQWRVEAKLLDDLATPTNITAATGVVLSGVTHTGAVIPTVSAVTGLTAANLDAAVTSRMATYTQPTGFLAATFPATVASTTNITAGTITTTTNLTNLPAITANWLTAAGIAASALDGKGNWNIGKTGYSLTQAFPTNFSALAITAGGIVDADIEAITGDTGAATKLERVLSGNTTGTVGAGSTTTSVVTSSLNPAASVTDQFKGLILKFDDATTTAALRGQGTDITASTAAGVLTCTALTTSPVSGDVFVIS